MPFKPIGTGLTNLAIIHTYIPEPGAIYREGLCGGTHACMPLIHVHLHVELQFSVVSTRKTCQGSNWKYFLLSRHLVEGAPLSWRLWMFGYLQAFNCSASCGSQHRRLWPLSEADSTQSIRTTVNSMLVLPFDNPFGVYQHSSCFCFF